MATLYAVICEYDIGLNFTGNSGVYSSSEARDQAVVTALERMEDEVGSRESLEEDGLLTYEELEG